MNHISNLDNLTRTTRRREFDDGLMDFVYASTFLIISLLGWLCFSPKGIRWLATALIFNREITIIGLISLVPLLVLLIFGARRVVDRIRRSIIWVDRGFVKALRWQVSWPINLIAVVVSIIMIITAVGLMRRGSIGQDAVLIALVSSIGVATGIVYFGMGIELKLLRYKWVGITGAVLSVLLIPMPISFSVSCSIVAVLAGCESADFTYLLKATGLTKGTLSKHLSKLREAGYVAIEKGYKGNDPHTSAKLTSTGTRAFKKYRRQYISFSRKM
jgi:DNA-binding transcriptional ArsR family regulator